MHTSSVFLKGGKEGTALFGGAKDSRLKLSRTHAGELRSVVVHVVE